MTITTKYNPGDTVWSAWPSGEFTQYIIHRIDVAQIGQEPTWLHYLMNDQTRRFAEHELFPTLADCWNDLAQKHEELAATYRANAEKAETIEQV